jgi:hypothetical protein
MEGGNTQVSLFEEELEAAILGQTMGQEEEETEEVEEPEEP